MTWHASSAFRSQPVLKKRRSRRRRARNNMEITQQQAGQFTELLVKGRLDGYWAGHLSSALEDVIRGGADHVRLNLAGVSYVSSMGIRVLLQFYQQLNGIHGV